MSNTNAKYATAAALGAVLTSAGLTVQVLQGERDQPPVYPGVAILPRKFRFESSQGVERDKSVSAGGASVHQLVERGSLVGKFELRAYSAYPAEREALETAVQDAFMADRARPGTLVVQLAGLTIGGTAFPYVPNVACRWGDGDWTEEMVFSQKRFSFTEVDVRLPVLAQWTLPLISQVLLQFTEDLASVSPTVTQVQVNANGTITPA